MSSLMAENSADDDDAPSELRIFLVRLTRGRKSSESELLVMTMWDCLFLPFPLPIRLGRSGCLVA